MCRGVLDQMTQTTATTLLYLGALFLTVATLWPFIYITQPIFPKKTNPQFVWVLIGVVIPFVMLFYFGAAFLISDRINEGATWLTAKEQGQEQELSFSESLAAAVSYVGLSGWVWLRWRNPKAPSTRILGSIIIATVIILIIVSVIWAAHYDHYFEWPWTELIK
jgi:hypothetical protein